MSVTLVNRTTNETRVVEDGSIFGKNEKSRSIVEYARSNMKTLSEKPFGDVDSLILSQLCYMHIGRIVPGPDSGRPAVSVSSLYKAEYFDIMLREVRDPASNMRLLAAVCASPRYRDIKANYFVDNVDEKSEKQFCAVTFFLPDGHIYIAYRGTDASVVGWKEDFNMIFEDGVPSQRSALTYLEKVARMTDRPIYLGGHSKGGNLALYAAAMAAAPVQGRIRTVYNHDGPGLSDSILERCDYARIQDRVRTTLPQYSLIGIIFNDGDYTAVKSDRLGIMQHDPFSWEIDGDEFICTDRVAATSGKAARSVKELAGALSEQEKRMFVDTVFDIIYSTGSTSFAGWPGVAIKEGNRIVDALKSIDPHTARQLKEILAEMFRIIFRNMLLPKRKNEQE